MVRMTLDKSELLYTIFDIITTYIEIPVSLFLHVSIQNAYVLDKLRSKLEKSLPKSLTQTNIKHKTGIYNASRYPHSKYG